MRFPVYFLQQLVFWSWVHSVMLVSMREMMVCLLLIVETNCFRQLSYAISNPVKRVVVLQLQKTLREMDYLNTIQSCFRPRFSIKTVLVILDDDLMWR